MRRVKIDARQIVVVLFSLLGLFIFANGFFLTKVLTTEKNEEDFDNKISEKFDSLTIVIVDALRFDFFYSSFDPTRKSFYEGNFQKSIKWLNSHKNNYRLYETIADAPTTTLQRLTGIITGSLPTFIEAGANFGGGDEINEDNLIYQLVKRFENDGRLFVGDDTWMTMLSLNKTKLFTHVHPYPSFNVRDLDTVDDGIREIICSFYCNKRSDGKCRMEMCQHIRNISKENRDDIKFILLHLLGIDHCGHRYGADHLEMKRKQMETDDFLYNLLKYKVKSKELLIVLGDHGMTNYGDHGGDSHLEKRTTTLFYSPQWKFDETVSEFTEITQIDLVPTISSLMNVNIPYSNLGILIPSIFHDSSKQYRTYLKKNYRQILNYLNNYPSLKNRINHMQYIHILLTSSNGLKS
ncbi:hypothetical protein SNEBB_000601 [Seison nebaliae]|nr:hypothetical protein SNEBB_000601 [Seison nebaliae]